MQTMVSIITEMLYDKSAPQIVTTTTSAISWDPTMVVFLEYCIRGKYVVKYETAAYVNTHSGVWQ